MEKTINNITEVERFLLGELLSDKRTHHIVVPLLNAEMFTDPVNTNIFTALQELYIRYEPIDMITVTKKLHSLGTLDAVGGAYYLTTLTHTVGTGANAEGHARIIIEEWTRREILSICTHFLHEASNETIDIYTTLSDMQTQLMALSMTSEAGHTRHIKEVVKDVFENAKKAKENPHTLLGIPSGFTELDRMTNGFREPDLVVIAARPGMGKTALVMNIARKASEQGYPVGIFSLEMSSEQLTQRMLSMESGVESGNIERGVFDLMDLAGSVSKIAGLPIYLNDKAAISANDIYASARKMVIEFGVKMIFIDYIQLVTDRSDRHANREQQVSNISRSFKMMAKELKIPVVALSQLSRNVESRSDKRPILSDLRESGAIEQDADRVMFMYRPDYYGITEDDGENVEGKVELIIAKHRGGALGTVNLKFYGSTTSFDAWQNMEVGGNYQTDYAPF